MLTYTGHPLIDVGAAAMAALVAKDDPARLTEDDYRKVADFIERNYTVQPLKSFLNVAFLNSGFTQPAFESQPEKRRLYAEKVARSFGQDVPKADESCVFTGDQASAISFSVDGVVQHHENMACQGVGQFFIAASGSILYRC